MVFAANLALATGLGALKGQDCIEFGCGTGRNLAAMAASGARTLTGLDLSQEMLDVARTRNQATSSVAWTLMGQDMTAVIPLSGACANFVLFSLSLEHIADLAAPLAQARRLLRKGGMIRIVEIHPFLSLNGIAAHFRDGDEDITMPTFPHQFQNWVKAFQQTGLVIDALREWHGRDFGESAPIKITRHGPDRPWLLDVTLRAR
jgi:ubiquinone/menaquinone biosynthesis C-methylase UbiE